MPKSIDNLNHLARIGAAERVKQLDRERAAILRMFPGLLQSRLVRTTGAALTPRRKPSAAARRAMSEGMRKFWARRKAAMKK